MVTDAETVAAVLNGRREAFADLVRRHEAAVYAVAWSVLRDRHVAQDACQDAFVAAYRRLATLRDPAAFGSWLLTIARHQALTLAGRKRHEQAFGDLPEVPVGEGDGGLDERAELLLAAVTTLPEHERTAVMLKYFGGHSLEEISTMTGRPIGTIGAQLHRARARLRVAIEEVKP